MIIVPIIPDSSPAKYHFNAVPMSLGGFSFTSSWLCDSEVWPAIHIMLLRSVQMVCSYSSHSSIRLSQLAYITMCSGSVAVASFRLTLTLACPLWAV